jgi:hypothetical protein
MALNLLLLLNYLFLQKKQIAQVQAIKYSLPNLTAKLTQGFAEGKGSASARALVENYKSTVADDNETGWGVAAGA